MNKVGLNIRQATWEAVLDMYANGRDPDRVEQLFAHMQSSQQLKVRFLRVNNHSQVMHVRAASMAGQLVPEGFVEPPCL